MTLFVVELRPVSGERGRGLRGFTRDLTTAAGDLARHPVLARLVTLSAVACLGIVAPEALALPIAGQNGWGGVLMASPIVGAVVGIILIGRRDVHQQNRSIVPLALAMPIPLLLIAVEPPIWLVAALFFVSGMMQAFMVPLQATFALVTEPALRGRIFSLAGSVSIAAAGLSYLAAGWVGQHSSAYLAVTICAGVCLAPRLPHRRDVAPQPGPLGRRPRLRDDVLPRRLSDAGGRRHRSGSGELPANAGHRVSACRWRRAGPATSTGRRCPWPRGRALSATS